MSKLVVALHAAVAALLAMTMSSTAVAIPVGLSPADYTFSFSGECADCIVDAQHPNGGPGGTASATLSLKDYSLGNDLTLANFVHFTYTSAKLGTLEFEHASRIVGSFLTTDPAPAQLFIDLFGPLEFTSLLNGNWGIGAGSILDFGSNGVFVGRAVDEVPEPISLALLAGGLAAFGLARRRVTS